MLPRSDHPRAKPGNMAATTTLCGSICHSVPSVPPPRRRRGAGRFEELAARTRASRINTNGSEKRGTFMKHVQPRIVGDYRDNDQARRLPLRARMPSSSLPLDPRGDFLARWTQFSNGRVFPETRDICPLRVMQAGCSSRANRELQVPGNTEDGR